MGVFSYQNGTKPEKGLILIDGVYGLLDQHSFKCPVIVMASIPERQAQSGLMSCACGQLDSAMIDLSALETHAIPALISSSLNGWAFEY